MQQLLASEIPAEVAQRFWAKVDRTQGCWLWMGSKDKRTGYGQFWIPKKSRRAHRVMYALEHGKTPADQCVLHNCDNPSCVNPEHLWLGTQLENIEDRMRKGRSNRTPTVIGEEHHSSPLQPKDVKEIRRRRKSGELYREIAEDFPVTERAVGRICRREVWKHV